MSNTFIFNFRKQHHYQFLDDNILPNVFLYICINLRNSETKCFYCKS